MAHTFNRDQLVTRILQKHRVIGEGQSATDGQRAIADGVVDPAIEDLRRRDVVSLVATGEMPIAYKEHLAAYCAYFCAEDFSRPPDVAAKTYAEIQMRFIQADEPTFQEVEVDPLHAPSYAAGYPRYRRGGYR